MLLRPSSAHFYVENVHHAPPIYWFTSLIAPPAPAVPSVATAPSVLISAHPTLGGVHPADLLTLTWPSSDSELWKTIQSRSHGQQYIGWRTTLNKKDEYREVNWNGVYSDWATNTPPSDREYHMLRNARIKNVWTNHRKWDAYAKNQQQFPENKATDWSTLLCHRLVSPWRMYLASYITTYKTKDRANSWIR